MFKNLRRRSYLLAIAVLLVLALAIWAGTEISRASALDSLSPKGTSVLHIQAERKGPTNPTSLEAWIDLSNYEGKILEKSSDGAVTLVSAVVGNAAIDYLVDANHAVIRHFSDTSSPEAARIRDRLFVFYRIAAERGARIVGTGQIGDREVDVVEVSIEDATLLVSADKATGLILRQEITQLGQSTQTIETTYPLIEYMSRSAVPEELFRIDLPENVNREEYFEADSNDANAPAISYDIYAMADGFGELVAEFRRFSSSDSVSSDAYYMIYRGDVGEVQIISGLPPDPNLLSQSAQHGQMPDLISDAKVIEFEGAKWEINSAFGPVRASTTLDGTYVTIFAPNEETLKEVIASLKRLN